MTGVLHDILVGLAATAYPQACQTTKILSSSRQKYDAELCVPVHGSRRDGAYLVDSESIGTLGCRWRSITHDCGRERPSS